MDVATALEPQHRVLRADARRNYELLLVAARSVFAELGPDAPLDEIPRRAGVGIGTLYRHFPTRLSIQEAVISDHMEALNAAGADLERDLGPGEALEAWLRLKLESAREYRGLGAAVMLAQTEETARFSSVCRRYKDRTSSILERAQRDGATRADVSMSHLLKLVHGIALATEKSEDRVADGDHLLAIVLDGLRAPAGRR